MSFPVDGIAPHRNVVPPEQPGPWWWACSHPERPPDGWTMYLTACEPCQMALAVLAAQEPDDALDWHDGVHAAPTESLSAAQTAVRTGAVDRFPVPKRIPSDR